MESPMNASKVEAIDDLLSLRSDFFIEQVNGQRLYRKKGDGMAKPDQKRGLEVFIGRLPRNCFEDELVPLFENFGHIHQLRLMMDFSGNNRGYAFLEYVDPSSARTAAQRLDGCEIRPGHVIGVMLSWDKSRLFIGGIPKNKRKKDVLKEMRRVTDGVKDVILYMSVYNNKNRGFCFVEYETHHDAAMARRRLGPGFKLWNNQEVRVDWADPEPDVDDEVMKQVKILHVRGLSLAIDENQIKEVFTFDGLRIERVKKIRDFAFVHYSTREELDIAMDLSTNIEFSKNNQQFNRIQVSLARPQKNKVLRKRAVSNESTPTESSSSTSMSTPMFTPPNTYPTPQSQLTNQLRYYQTMCGANDIQNPALMNQITPYSSSGSVVPLKYDPIVDDKNVNFFVVWVPVVWLPNNQNKDLIDSSILYTNSI